jgi:uncharacterized protein YbjT (DUF2867 family)
MKIVVMGGTGLIGTKLVNRLRQGSHEVVAASPSSGVDAVTGEGLAAALANAPSWEDQAVLRFFEASSRNLLAAEAAAGVRHHVALSVVGTERLLDSGYFRAKLAQEKLIKSGKVPYTIVRATQFFEFFGGIAQSGAEGQIVRMPAAMFQPMAADDVAAALAVVAVGPPLNGMLEIAGPERKSMAELVQRFLSAKGDSRQVVADAQARYFGLVVNDRSLTPDEGARLGATRLEDWLRQSVGTAPSAPSRF